MIMKKIYTLVFSLILFTAIKVNGQTTYTWSGLTSSDVSNANNWIPITGTPTNIDSVIIPAAAPNMPVLDPLVFPFLECKGLFLQGTITILDQGIFSLNGVINPLSTGNIISFSGSEIDIGANPPGSIGINVGALNFNATNHTLSQLVINNGYTLKLGSTLAIDNYLLMTAGPIIATSSTFDLDGKNLIFRSNGTRTANLYPLRNAINGILSSMINATNVTIERDIKAIGRKWRLLSGQSTTTSQTIFNSWQENGANGNTFPNMGTWITSPAGNVNGYDTSSRKPSILKYNKTDSSWSSLAGTSTLGSINNEQGYMLYVRGDRRDKSTNATNRETVLRTTGTLNQGPQAAITITVPTNAPPGTSYTMVGNPYPSVLDYDSIYAFTPNIGQDYYIWDPQYAGNYGVGGFRLITRNGANSYSALPNSGIVDPTTLRYINSGSAVFLKATGSNASLVLNEKLKSAQSPLLNNEIPVRPGLAPPNQLDVNLMIVNPGNVESLGDGTRVLFDEKFSASTSDDADKMFNFGENIYSLRENRKLILERRPLIQNRDTLFLRVTGTGIKDYRLNINSKDFSQPGVIAYLLDNYLNTKTHIDLTGNITVVDFKVTNDAASAAADRFMIVFSAPNPLPAITFIKGYQQKGNINLEWKVAAEKDISQYEIEHSTDGIHFTNISTVSANGNNGSNQFYTGIDVNAVFGYNYYRVRMVGNNGSQQYSDIVKVNMESVSPVITIFPNPVQGRMVNIQLTAMAEGIYTVRLLNNMGQSLLEQRFTYMGGTNTRQVHLGNTAKGKYSLEITGPDNNKELKPFVIAQ